MKYFASFFYILSSVVTIFFLNLYAIKSYKHKEGFNLVLYQFSHFPRKPAEVMRNPSWKMRSGAEGRPGKLLNLDVTDIHATEFSSVSKSIGRNWSGECRMFGIIYERGSKLNSNMKRQAGNESNRPSSMTRAFWLSGKFANKRGRGNRLCYSKHLCRGRDTAG